jgi:hypothetical protein
MRLCCLIPIQGAISEQDLTSSSKVSSWMLLDSSEYFVLLKVKSVCYMVISVAVLWYPCALLPFTAHLCYPFSIPSSTSPSEKLKHWYLWSQKYSQQYWDPFTIVVGPGWWRKGVHRLLIVFERHTDGPFGMPRAEWGFWLVHASTHNLTWCHINLDQHLELAWSLIWSELALKSTRISGNTRPARTIGTIKFWIQLILLPALHK